MAEAAGKRVLVTGASRGIGLATVRAFLAEGAEVTAASRTMTPELEATGAAFVSADLATPHGPERMVGAALGVLMIERPPGSDARAGAQREDRPVDDRRTRSVSALPG